MPRQLSNSLIENSLRHTQKTMTQPLISIMMPCYNASSTLAKALASLQAQTYSNWECVFVDDGSTDDPINIVKQFNDSRIRTFKFEHNQGRGAARQLALENAKGDYLCMLDADDWYYPDKLEKQLAFMENAANRHVILCAPSIAIFNQQRHLVGIRKYQSASTKHPITQKFATRPAAIAFTHASIMIRMDKAKQARYSTKLHQAEDVDWLWQILPNHHYALLPNIGYAYNEYASSDRNSVINAYTQSMKVLWLHRHGAWSYVIKQIALEFLKQMLFRLAFPLGLADALIAKRAGTTQPSLEDMHDFEQAEKTINQALSKILKQ